MSLKNLRESSSGASPEDIMRKIFLRWANFKLSAKLLDLRDLFRSENLLSLTEACMGGPVPDCIAKPALPADHDANYSAVVTALATKTKIEWGASKLTAGLKAKQLGFLEILLWHLVEVGELQPMGLPIGSDSLNGLSTAIEERLGNFIKLKQFHFRFTKEMIFDIVHDCSSWEPDKSLNDVQNLRSAFDNIEGWGIPTLVDPADIKNMGSVNERGFLMFFAFFLPSLEGVAGPKKKKTEEAPPTVVAIDTTPFTDEIERLRLLLAEVSGQKLQVEDVNVAQAQEIAELKKYCGKLQETNRRNDEALEHLNAQKRENAEKLASLKEQCEQSEEARSASQARVRTLEEEAQAVAKEVVQLQALLEATHKASTGSQQELQTQLTASQSLAASTKAELDAVKTQLAAAQKEAEATKKALTNQVIQARSELEDVQIELDEFRNESASSKKVAAALAVELQHSNQTRESSVSTLSKDQQALRERLAELGAQVESQQLQLEARDAQESTLQIRIAELEALAATQKFKLENANFDGLEEGYQRLLGELNQTRQELVAAKQDAETMSKQMRAIELKMPLFMRQGKNTVEPPQGEVTLVFTDVEGSTVQWEWDAELMAPAIRAHNDILRKLLHEHGGYEVKTEGDAFMCAFGDPLVAVRWCMDAQEELLKVEWPEKIYQHSKSQIVKSETGKLLYKGLRVRMGIHTGTPSCEEDPVTGRMDYFGPMVNRAARVESVAHGGQIVMSSDVHDRVLEQLQHSPFHPQIKDLGSFELKGLQEATHIYQVLPESLCERVFEVAVTKESELANEKKKLEEQLKEMQEKNNALAEKLVALDQNVKGQISQATKLLSDVQDSKMDGQPPREMLQSLRQQLQSLLYGQTATAEELDRARVANEELMRVANDAAARRELIAVQSIELQKRDLELSLGDLRAEMEESKRIEAQLQQELRQTQQSLEAANAEAARLAEAAQSDRAMLRGQLAELEGDSKKVAELKSLQAAMARRIESLENDIDGSRERANKNAAVLRSETDRWAAVEADLKKQIRDLEARIKKIKSAQKKEGK